MSGFQNSFVIVIVVVVFNSQIFVVCGVVCGFEMAFVECFVVFFLLFLLILWFCGFWNFSPFLWFFVVFLTTLWFSVNQVSIFILSFNNEKKTLSTIN